MKIYPYNSGSASAKALAESLGIKRLRREGGSVKDDVINWGCSRIPRYIEGSIINWPAAVKTASNKLETFKALDGYVGIPEYTKRLLEAQRWLAEGFTVVSRLKLNGHSGEGIVISKGMDNIPEAPLHTKYIPKKGEYRVHVFRNEVFFVQRKARKMDVPNEEVNWKVRNLAGGFIFAHKGVNVPDEVEEECIIALDVLCLDFGACDVVEGLDGKWYVLEVNTACGLEGTTLEKYAEQFRRLM